MRSRLCRLCVLPLALLYALSLSACGSNSSPTAPTTPTGSTATFAITNMTASVEGAAGSLTYHVAFHLAETSGRSGATLASYAFTFNNSSSATVPLTQHVVASAAGDIGPVNITDSSGRSAGTTVTLTVNFTDDAGHVGTAAASASVTFKAPDVFVTIFGVLTDAATRKAIGGASVNVTDSRGTVTRSGTDGNGYFSIAPVLAGAVTVRGVADGYDTVTQNTTVSADTQINLAANKSGPPVPAVEYRITGTARRCSATYENSSGGTNQSEVNIPFSYTWPSARSGDFLYMSCQIDTGGDQGNITVSIYRNGVLYKSAQANGFPNIATASGSY